MLFAEWLEHWGVTFTSAVGGAGCNIIVDASLKDDHDLRRDASQASCQPDLLPTSGRTFDGSFDCRECESPASYSVHDGIGESVARLCGGTRKLGESYVRVSGYCMYSTELRALISSVDFIVNCG